MAIDRHKPETALMTPLKHAVRMLLESERAERWSKLLESGKGLEKLSPFEFFDLRRRAERLAWNEIKGWPQFEQAITVHASRLFLGLQWQGRAGVALIKGSCKDFVEYAAQSRTDCWIVVPEKKVSIVTTHEGDHAVMSW
jgi:hypothetical protein